MTVDKSDKVVAAQIRGCIYWGTDFGLALAAVTAGIFSSLMLRTEDDAARDILVITLPILVCIGIPIGVQAYKKRHKNVPDIVANEIQKSLSSSVRFLSMSVYILLWIVGT